MINNNPLVVKFNIGEKFTLLIDSAQSCGFLCEENDGQSGPTVKYVGYCQYHWNRRVGLYIQLLVIFCNVVCQPHHSIYSSASL